MKILQIIPRIPYPVDAAAKIDYLNFAQTINKNHRITLLCFEDQPLTMEGENYLKQYFDKIETVPFPKSSILKMIKNGLFNATPYTIQKYYSNLMEQKIRSMLTNEKFDFVRIDQMHMAHYIHLFKDTPVILRKHNIDIIIMKRLYETDPRWYIRYYAYWQWKKMVPYECRISSRFNRCVLISPEDEKILHQFCPGIPTSTITCGMDLTRYPVAPLSRQKPYRITFLGTMDWLPNEDGVIYFIEDILPIIRKKVPEIEFYIVGRSPGERVNRFRDDPGIYITGFVENIIPYLAKTGVFVVPLRIGSGMRIKILEAMSMGNPIVTTSVGMEGIEAIHGNELLIADNPADFADAVCQILDNDELACRLSESSQKLIRQKYSNESVGQQWENLIREIYNAYYRK